MNADDLSDRDLDALVAQHLFGYTVERRTNARTGELDAVYNIKTGAPAAASWFRVPEYSRSLTSSLMVEMRLQERGWQRHSPPAGYRPWSPAQFTVTLEHRSDGRRVMATGPFETALCRAALKAVTGLA